MGHRALPNLVASLGPRLFVFPAIARMNPKTVVLDLGNVLIAFNYDRAVRRLHFRSRISVEEMRSLIDHSPLLHRLESGGMTAVEFFQEVRRQSGFNGDFVEFAGIFADIFVPIDAMVAVHARLRARGVRLLLFSNTN